MKNTLILLASGIVLLSCVRPSVTETFVPASEGNPYVFNVSVVDSTASFDFSLYSRRDVSVRKLPSLASSRVIFEWRNPSDSLIWLRDTVFVDFGESGGVIVPYRDNVRLPSSGVWTISAVVDDCGPSFRGLGLICRENGAR